MIVPNCSFVMGHSGAGGGFWLFAVDLDPSRFHLSIQVLGIIDSRSNDGFDVD